MVDNLGGFGVFGVELFVKGEDVWFSEVSPRPHDTGLVTLVSQDLSEFALHARAILGLPIPAIRQMGASASAVILPEGDSGEVAYTGLEHALAELDTQLRLFGKPELKGRRRMGVALAMADTLEEARAKARRRPRRSRSSFNEGDSTICCLFEQTATWKPKSLNFFPAGR